MPPMPTRYLAAWANRKRAELMAELGNACKVDGCENDELEFHHPLGRDWTPSKHSRWQRMILYWRDYRAGRLEILCKPHNASDGQRFRGRARGGRRWAKRKTTATR